MKLRVTNNQRYAIGRGGFVFPPREEIEVTPRNAKKVAEIRACVYLDAREVHEEDDEPESPAVTTPELPPHVLKIVEEMPIVYLQEVADEFDVSKAGSKVAIAARLVEEGWEPGDDDDDEDDE